MKYLFSCEGQQIFNLDCETEMVDIVLEGPGRKYWKTPKKYLNVVLSLIFYLLLYKIRFSSYVLIILGGTFDIMDVHPSQPLLILISCTGAVLKINYLNNERISEHRDPWKYFFLNSYFSWVLINHLKCSKYNFSKAPNNFLIFLILFLT